MGKQKQELFDKFYDVINGYIDNEETSERIAGYLINSLPIIDEPSEVIKPVITYNIRFYNYMGELECVKETLYNDYYKGSTISYKNKDYIVKRVMVYEGETETDVIIFAHPTDY